MIAEVTSFSCPVVLIYKGDAAAITHFILAHNTSQFRKNLETKNFLTHVHSSFLYLRHIWYGILEMLDSNKNSLQTKQYNYMWHNEVMS